MAIPAAFAAVACITLSAAGMYMHVNRNKQVDDRYRLEFNRAEIEPNLYLGEDLPYVQGLVKTHTKQEPGVDFDSSGNSSSANEAFFDRKPARKTSIIPLEEPSQEDGLVCSY